MGAVRGPSWGRLGAVRLLWAAVLVLSGCGADGGPPEPAPVPPLDRTPADREVTLSPEAGFVDAVPGPLAAMEPVKSRLFYSFFPAESHPEDAPVLVFFNGGPGAATTGILWAFGTGPYSLDPAPDGAGTPSENPFPYTRFANLLYIDARNAGFSYDVFETEPSPSECVGVDDLRDALEFILTLLEFLDAHAPLRDNDVVLVGESYGGDRAVIMLSLLQHYAEGGGPASLLESDGEWLQDRVQAHFDRAFPTETGRVRAAGDVAEQFGWQVMIQPGILREYDDADIAAHPELQRVPGRSSYDTRRTDQEDTRLAELVQSAINEPASLALLLGMEPRDVPRLSPDSGRSNAFRYRSPRDSVDPASREALLRTELGELTPEDSYWIGYSQPCFENGIPRLPLFFELAGRTHTFLTNARYDTVVWSDGIRTGLESKHGAVHDPERPEGAARPGIITFTADDGASVEMRYPAYEAGHEVTIAAPVELGEDVEAWLRATGAIGQ